jgi:hypothetical protein
MMEPDVMNREEAAEFLAALKKLRYGLDNFNCEIASIDGAGALRCSHDCNDAAARRDFCSSCRAAERAKHVEHEMLEKTCVLLEDSAKSAIGNDDYIFGWPRLILTVGGIPPLLTT